MNYEFYVGDYVEDVRGHTGYIKDISEKSNTFTIVWRNYCGTDYTQMRWFDHYAPNRRKWEDDFLRIGAYDFTKKEKKKIEPLCISKTMRQYTGDGTTNSGSDYTAVYERVKFDDDILNKINELVDAVNELRNKENDE